MVIIVPMGTLIHELGHAAAALIAKADSVLLHIGTGKPFKTYVFNRLTIHLHSIFFIGGLTRSERKRTYNPKEKIWIALGGPLSNAIFVVLFILLFYPTHNPFIQLFLLFQAWMLVINIIPFKWKGKKSDGYIIFQTLAEKKTNDTVNK